MDTEKPDTNTPPREKRDKALSPLGRGANPGPSSEGATQIGSLHGAGVPGEKGGADGTAHRENEDSVQSARRDAR